MAREELLRQLEKEKQRRGMSSDRDALVKERDTRSQLAGERQFAWEFELEAYRAQRKRERWLAVGAFCGVLSLVMEVWLHWGQLTAFLFGLIR